MSNNTIEAIKNILVNDLYVDVPVNEINDEDGFQAILGLDSVGFIELRFQCEQIFKITISDNDFIPDNFKNLNVLSKLIDNLKAV